MKYNAYYVTLQREWGLIIASKIKIKVYAKNPKEAERIILKRYSDFKNSRYITKSIFEDNKIIVL